VHWHVRAADTSTNSQNWPEWILKLQKEEKHLQVCTSCFWAAERTRTCDPNSAAMENDPREKSLAATSKADDDDIDEGDVESDTEDNGNFLKPFLSGWQKVWGSRKKWFGAGPDSVQDQPKNPCESGSDDSDKDPATAIQANHP
jgi:hypothetical protein